MSVIRATYTTMGQSSPATVRDDADDGEDSYYRWRKIPGWVPNDPRCRKGAAPPPVVHPANATRATGRAARKAEYARLQLEEHLTKEQAAERLGICHSTMQTYQREFLGSLEEIAAQSPEQAALVAAFRRKQQRGESA